MRAKLLAMFVVLALGGCGSAQQPAPATAADLAQRRQQAEEEVTALATAHCQAGLHGPLAELADETIFIRGTAGETMEGLAALQEMNDNYQSGNIEVVHRCPVNHREVSVSPSGDVVWIEEGLRTHVDWPENFSVEFPSQRTMIFVRDGEGWRLRYYALSVALPDAALDETFGEPGTVTPTVGSTAGLEEGEPAAEEEAAPEE